MYREAGWECSHILDAYRSVLILVPYEYTLPPTLPLSPFLPKVRRRCGGGVPEVSRRCPGGGAEVRRFCAACALACARCVFGHLGSSLKFSKIALSPARGGPAAYKCSSRLRVVRLIFSPFSKKCSRLRVVPKFGRISLSPARGAFALSPARRGLFCTLQHSRLRGVGP